MSYTLTPVPHSLGTPDGFLAKTNKASMLHFLLKDINEEVPYPKEAFFIQDGNALFHELKDLPPTFGGICLARWLLRENLSFPLTSMMKIQ